MDGLINAIHFLFNSGGLMYRKFLLPKLVLFSFIFSLSLLAQDNPWTTKTDMLTARNSLTCSAINGKVYVIGGELTGTYWGDPASPIVEAYDPVTDSWEGKTPMSIGRNSFSCNTVNGKIYVFGGQSHVGTINISSVEEYDPITDSWTFKTPMPDVRAGLSSCVVNEKIYVIGGWKYSGPNSYYHFREIWEYDPVNDTWDTNKALMPTGREYLTSSVVDEKIYVFGGWDESVAFKTVEMYDPATDMWDTMADMPEKRVYLSSGVVNKLIYIFGGSTLGNVLPKSDTWEYNPVTDSCRAVSSMPMGIMQAAASEVSGKIYSFGGTSLPISFPMQASSKVFEYNPHHDLLPFIANFNVDKSYAIPGVDSVLITSKINNPAGITLLAKIEAGEVPVDSVELFDDGNHNDRVAGDSLFANSWPVPPVEEKNYNINLHVTRVDTDTVVYYLNNMAHLTTIGPVTIGNTLVLVDTIRPGATLVPVKLLLRNMGTITTASDIYTQIFSIDTSLATLSILTIPSYGNILPGDSAETNIRHYIDISESCPVNIDVFFKVDISSNGHVFWSDTFYVHIDSIVTSVRKEDFETPKEFALKQNYPNPFNPKTVISYQLPKTSDVELAVYNLLGQKVATLVSKKQPVGTYNVEWDATGFSSGVYIYTLETNEGYKQSKKLVLLK